MAIDPNNLSGTAHITFNDDFNSLNLWNGTSGTWATNYWYNPLNGNGGSLPTNGEQQWYINANYAATSSVKPWAASNGVLTITAAPASSSISPLINNYKYTSGEINTYQSFSQTYGYFEMRAQLPAGQGFWPAFWLLPKDGAWPPELDVMEVLGNNTSKLYNTVHSDATGTHTAVGPAGGVNTPDLSAGYHTFGVDWEADYITFYFDGQQTYKTATPADMHGPMYMIANLAAGGYWPGNVNPGSTAQMKIDYIRAYASGAGAGAPVTSEPAHTAPATPTPTPTPTATPVTNGAVSTNAGSYTAADGVKSITLTGSHQTVTGNNAGDTFTSNNTGNHLIGGTGADTFIIGRGGDVVTGGGGADTFTVKETPWAAGGHITDFTAADKLDLTGMLAHLGYTGSDPVGAGYLKISADSAGQAQVWAHMDNAWWVVTTLDGVSQSSLKLNGGVITETASGPASTAPAGSAVSTGAATYVAPSGVTSVTLTGSHQTVTGNDAGDTFTSNNTGNHLIGGAGADTFIIGRGGDVVTGGGGADVFAFKETPWAAQGHITDFGAGDKIDMSGALAKSGYTGSDPVGAGYLKVTTDAAGNGQVWSHMDNAWWLATTVDHVSAASLHVNGAFITG